jgi:hypothetical protein
MMAPQLEVLPGLPHPPAFLKGTSRQTYPVLEWPPSSDDDIEFYRVYRVEDSLPDTAMTAQISDTFYIDLSVAAAHIYEYFVTSVDSSGKESVPTPSITLVPLQLTSGILALNANPGNITSNLVYHLDFADTLFSRALESIGYTGMRTDSEIPLTIFDLAPYSMVIVSSENRAGALSADLEELLPIYLANGGKVIFILRHAAVAEYPGVTPRTIKFGGHSFFSKYLMVDSSRIGSLVVEPGYKLAGDMVGATPVASLPEIVWDSVRVNQFGYNVLDGLPYCGYLWPREPAEVIYQYKSSDSGGQTHGQVNGIRYQGEDYQFYLLNFPLSLMTLDSAAALLQAAVIDLEEHFICGDVNGDLCFNIGDVVAYVQWLYRELEPSNLFVAGDVDCSGTYDLADALILINYYCNKGLAPGCCR